MFKIAILFLFISSSFCQQIDYNPQFSNLNNKADLQKGLLSTGILALTVISIYETGKPIYYNEQKSKFHFTRYNGSLEWFDNGHRGLDKFGHFFSSSLFAQNIYFLSRWSGLNNKTASFTSLILASSIMGAMEVHDAYYKRWGFAAGDFLFNVMGASFYIGQQNISAMRNLDYKISYDFTKQKDDQAVIESYANMTFWLTANPSGFFASELPGWFPNWLNIAMGISVTHSYPKKTELIIGLDYNLKRIKTKSVFLNHVIHILDRYRFPAPAIRLAPGFIGYGLYF
jgi:Predicted periplasmic lipoprotein (DUF2279)